MTLHLVLLSAQRNLLIYLLCIRDSTHSWIRTSEVHRTQESRTTDQRLYLTTKDLVRFFSSSTVQFHISSGRLHKITGFISVQVWAQFPSPLFEMTNLTPRQTNMFLVVLTKPGRNPLLVLVLIKSNFWHTIFSFLSYTSMEKFFEPTSTLNCESTHWNSSTTISVLKILSLQTYNIPY